MKDEALRLALEALEAITKSNQSDHQAEIAEDAITAIKAALEAKDEPVAWAMLHDNGHFIGAIHPNEHAIVEGEYITPLYTTPPQRTWVGLTDEEILVKCEAVPDYDIGNHDLIQFARAIEAKLKEKNNVL